ncbi:MAG: ATP-binding cassette domain-containing protein [Burkholderiaceae bacterium]|nr:ATP-binding cassette domain-containing protein [Burkholderiaceae bacterium]
MVEAVVSVQGLRKSYAGKHGRVQALQGLDFTLRPGKSLAIVGESGSGKTTAAMCVAKLVMPDAGAVHLAGSDFLQADARSSARLRRHFGVVLQNPLTSLDPRVRIWRSVCEPLQVHEPGLTKAQLRERALALLARVGLDANQAERLPHQLSGGQLQRAVIARALILRPQFVILDEPTSALDVSVQAQVLNLLCDLRDEFQLSYLFITHNLALVEIIAHEVLVMYAGAVVERGPVHRVFAQPRHPYTAELLAAVPGGPLSVSEPATAAAESGFAATGCAYRPRCPRAQALCADVQPAPASEAAPVSCFFPLGESPR